MNTWQAKECHILDRFLIIFLALIIGVMTLRLSNSCTEILECLVARKYFIISLYLNASVESLGKGGGEEGRRGGQA